MGIYGKNRFLTAIFIIIAILAAASCSKQVSEEIDQSVEESFMISGLTGEPISISIDSLKKMPLVTKKVVSVSASGEKKDFTATGPVLEELLKSYKKSQKDLDGIRFIAGDGYSIEVPKKVLENRDIILAFEMDGAPLDQESRPVRVVIPDERAMYWIRNLIQIEVLHKQDASALNKLYFVETLVSNIPQQDYTYYESVDRAVKVVDLLNAIEKENVAGSIHLKAVDGLEKDESKDVFLKGYIKISGKESPVFLSPDMPKGMHVKDILWFTYGENVVFTLEKGFERLSRKPIADKMGILINEIIKEVGLASAKKYLFTAENGHQVEVNVQDLEKGFIYEDHGGKLCTYFEDLPQNRTLEGILSIEAMK